VHAGGFRRPKYFPAISSGYSTGRSLGHVSEIRLKLCIRMVDPCFSLLFGRQ
jgi:hypothetical protein